MKPLIGITTGREESSQGYPQLKAAEAYVQTIANAGGLPVLIPLGLDEPLLAELTGRLDGLLLTGGGDIHPRHYGGSSEIEVMRVDEDRDRVEFALLRHALRDDLPFLGVCRGLQVVNVALGGSLYVDLATERPEGIEHRYYPDWPREHRAHTVNITPGSLLARMLGASQIQVNSLHHQGVRELAPGLVASAVAPDGLIEGLEVPQSRFGLAVQWHPENLQDDPVMRALFAGLVQAAGGR